MYRSLGLGLGLNLTNKTTKGNKMKTDIKTIEINGVEYVEKGSATTIEYKQPEGELLQVGKNYFIRTFSFHYVGKLVAINENNLILENASWVADSGRFSEALANGTLSETEKYVNDVVLFRNSLLDATEWQHELPLVSK